VKHLSGRVGVNVVRDVPWKAFGWIGLTAAWYSALTLGFGDFWDWLNTFVATPLSVFAGVLLYRHQTNRAAKEREDQLLTAPAGELRSCLGILRERPTPFRVPVGIKSDTQGQTVFTVADIGNAVLVPLPKVIVEEALRIAVFNYSDSLLLSNAAGYIRVHNSNVSFILSARENLVTQTMLLSLQRTLQELNQRQNAIRADCEALLRHLASEGIEISENPKWNSTAERATSKDGRVTLLGKQTRDARPSWAQPEIDC
jgi:hypothetical protein